MSGGVSMPSRLLHWVPIAVVWVLALWPFGLWLVHLQDPVAAVRLAAGTSSALWLTAKWTAIVGGALLLLFPPAPAWLRLAATRTWRNLTNDPLPLQRALAELQHFESAARHFEVGRLLRLARNLGPAIGHLRRAVELDPTIASAHHQLGLGAFSLHHFEDAAVCFANAEHLDPGHAFGDALLHLGRSQFRGGDVRAAADTLRTHQRQHGGSPRSHLWLADALFAIGERDAALEALRIAAAPPKQRLTAEENWFRARARVRLWRRGGGQ